jgi:hypothetical protein
MAIGCKLCAHGVVGVACVLCGTIDEMQENTAALDMAKETVA